MDQTLIGSGRQDLQRLPCCVFQRALLAVCEMARARRRREGEIIDCAPPVAEIIKSVAAWRGRRGAPP